jgi:nitric oxide reductase NorE protein
VVTLSDTTEPLSPGRPTRVPGESGTWFFIFGDMAVFAAIFVGYLAERAQNPDVFNASAATLRPEYGVIYTLLLLTGSLFVVTGMKAVRRQAIQVGPWCFVGAFLCGLGFACLKVTEYHDKVQHGYTVSKNGFFAWFYVLTGLHFFHLIVGMAALVFLVVMSRRRQVMVGQQFAFIEGAAVFWHLVDLLWIVIFPLLYFVR